MKKYNGKMYEVKSSNIKQDSCWLQIIAIEKESMKENDNYGLALFLNGKKFADFIVQAAFRDSLITNKFTYIRDVNYHLYACNSVLEVYKFSKKVDAQKSIAYPEELREALETSIVERLTLYNETAYNLQSVLINAFKNPYFTDDSNLLLQEIPKDIEREIVI